MNLYLSELPTVGKNKALRSRYLRELHAGFHGPAIKEHFGTSRTNRTASGAHGNITFVRTQHFPGFSTHEIATQVATTYLPEIKGCLEVEEGSQHSSREIEFEYEIKADRYSLPDCLVEACERRDPEFLIAELYARPRHHGDSGDRTRWRWNNGYGCTSPIRDTAIVGSQ